jgi:hypothetical protein
VLNSDKLRNAKDLTCAALKGLASVVTQKATPVNALVFIAKDNCQMPQLLTFLASMRIFGVILDCSARSITWQYKSIT